jgi:2-oxoglutarate ferredoxin oxidoreductase subunit alpha
MSSDGGLTKPGTYFMMGNFACVEAAILAGCRFYAGYPITPSSEIFERACVRFPQVGGRAVEMEDEMASVAALVGASYAGAKVMTATSGPGFSLMMENIGLAYIMEAPMVLVNVQRAGPSTGIPTLVGQGDMMQAKWGSHGDLETIAYCPSSVQEFFDLTIQAFNTAERFRTPVFVMADQVVGMMWEKLKISPPGEAEVQQRRVMDPAFLKSSVPFDYLEDFIPMPVAGTDCRVNIDSLTHDAKGYPSTDHSDSEAMIGHLTRKIRDYSRELWMWEESLLEEAEVVVVAYGSTARSALAAVKKARALGIRAGLLRLITAWPFPDEVIDSVSRKANNLIVAEVNNGQMLHPVAESSRCPVVGVNWAPGTLIGPDTIFDALKAVAR